MPNVFPWSPWCFVFFFFFFLIYKQIKLMTRHTVGIIQQKSSTFRKEKQKKQKRDLLFHPNLQIPKHTVFNHILSKRTIRNTGMNHDSVNFNMVSRSFQNKLGQWRKKEMKLHLSILQSAECEESWCNPQGSWARSGTARKMLLPSYRWNLTGKTQWRAGQLYLKDAEKKLWGWAVK